MLKIILQFSFRRLNHGWITAKSSGVIDLNINAEGLAAGTHSTALMVSSNDPFHPLVPIAIELEVYDNVPPVITSIPDVAATETQTANFTISAVDSDDSTVTLSLVNAPAFVTLVSSGNGTATYSLNPSIGRAGTYTITINAVDTRGMTTDTTFQLTVIPYGVESFSLVDKITNTVVTTFTTGIVVNRQDPNFNNYVVRANTNPGTVGSIQFTLDGKNKNMVNAPPYIFKESDFNKLKVGSYQLGAKAFTKASGKGLAGKSLVASVQIVNATPAKNTHMAGLDAIEEREGTTVNIYPVPVEQELIIQFTGNLTGEAKVEILNAAGYVFYQIKTDAAILRDLRLNTVNIGLSTGIYYVQITGVDGGRVIQRFVKR
jgi:Bacterial Ig domain